MAAEENIYARDDVTGGWRKLHKKSLVTCTPRQNVLSNQLMEVERVRLCSCHGKKKKRVQSFDKENMKEREQ
jgi:hypothetical protein